MTFPEFVSLLDARGFKPHANGSGTVSRCPGHDDTNPSLSIKQGDGGRILVNCHAGCSVNTVVAGLGLKMTDLFPEKPQAPHRRITDTYSYTDENGVELYQTLRYFPKDFRQRHRTSSGAIEWNLNGCRRVLFRLPELLAGVARGDTIYFCEGEKDVLAMVKAGFNATTAPMGSGAAWLPEYSEFLRGAHVVLIEDKDKQDPKKPDKPPQGFLHTRKVAKALHGIAASVKIIKVQDVGDRECKDPADYLAAGGDPQELVALATAAPESDGSDVWPGWGTPAAPANPTEDILPGNEEPAPTVHDHGLPAQDSVAKPSPDGPFIIIPSNHTPILDSAHALFNRIARAKRMFSRAGATVELGSDSNGQLSLATVTPEAFRSRIEGYGAKVVAYRVDPRGNLVLGEKNLSTDNSKALLASDPARTVLPSISLVTSSPVLVLDGSNLTSVDEGYSPLDGGVIVTTPCRVERMSTHEAVAILRTVIKDFLFVSPGDQSRAIASLITPAMKMAGLIPGFCPIEATEARESQSGKGYRDRLTHAIYGEIARCITRKQGGVGSTEESLAAAILSGRPFISIDNVRGKLDSQYFESVLTNTGLIECRIPGQKSVYVDGRRITFQLTSNGMESTPDLANRCSIVRITKQHDRTKFAVYPEGDIEAHIKANRGRFIGAVFQIIREWHAAGRPSNPNVNHDFRFWAGILDVIVQNLFGAAPLMEGHEESKARVSNPTLSWIRLIGIQALAEQPPGYPWAALDLAELALSSDIHPPNSKHSDPENAKRSIGRLMANAFKAASSLPGAIPNTLSVDGIVVSREEHSEYRPELRTTVERKTYSFSEPTF